MTSNPAYISQLTKEIVVIDGTLPPGWRYAAALDLMPARSVSSKNDSTATTVELTQANRKRAKDALPNTDGVALGTPTRDHDGRTYTAESTAVESIGNRSISMTRWAVTSKEGDEAQENGTTALSDNRAIYVLVLESGKRHYDPNLPIPIFKSIKDFVP